MNQAVHFDEKGLQSNSVCADHGLKPKKGIIPVLSDEKVSDQFKPVKIVSD